MTAHDTHSNMQAVRRVYENDQPASSSTSTGIIYLVCQQDASNGEYILLWENVLDAFKEGVIHIRSGAVVLPFLKGPDFKKLDPLRIAAVPGATLDVVVRGRPEQRELSLESLQRALPGAHQQGEHNNADPVLNTSGVATAKQTPAGELVEAAWENYTHIGNPNAGPARREPQEIRDYQGANNNSDNNNQSNSNSNISTSAKESNASSNTISLARAPQESTSDTTQDITKIMMNSRLGDMHAQNALGEMYKDGRGVHQDYQAAMDWYLKAARQEHAVAQDNIGSLYQHGHGVPQNYTKAMDWYIKAADQGLASAQHNIGCLYRDGHGVPQDYSAAMDWYLKAADQGNASVQNTIGGLYQHGRGVPQDYLQAMSWYQRAADQGNAAAQDLVAQMYEQGKGVSKDRAKAIEWYRKAVAGGDAEAKVNLDRLEQQSSDGDTGDAERVLFE